MDFIKSRSFNVLSGYFNGPICVTVPNFVSGIYSSFYYRIRAVIGRQERQHVNRQWSYASLQGQEVTGCAASVVHGLTVICRILLAVPCHGQSLSVRDILMFTVCSNYIKPLSCNTFRFSLKANSHFQAVKSLQPDAVNWSTNE